jgi:hypothetical protein
MVPAFDVPVVSCFAKTQERSPLVLASARAVGHAATLVEIRKDSAFRSRKADM